MILFQATLTVRKIEHKSLTTKAGKAFKFVEAICQTDEEKPTYLVARVVDGMELHEGLKAKFKIGISSYEGKDGRIWNNFILSAKEDIEEKKAEPQIPLEMDMIGDELPF